VVLAPCATSAALLILRPGAAYGQPTPEAGAAAVSS
jgi:hypothetical protein